QLERREPGFLAHLAQRGGFGLLAVLEVALRETPVLVAVADQEVEAFRSLGAKHDTACRRLVPRLVVPDRCRALFRLRQTPVPLWSVARPSMNWRTTGSSECLIWSTVPTCRTRPSKSIAMRVPTK